jgi:hypothetical protein
MFGEGFFENFKVRMTSFKTGWLETQEAASVGVENRTKDTLMVIWTSIYRWKDFVMTFSFMLLSHEPLWSVCEF